VKVLLGFVIGVLVGAGGLFAWLHQMPQDPAAQGAPVSAASLPTPAKPRSEIDGQLPPGPSVQPDLSELDLPLRPAVGDAAATGPNAAQPTALPDAKLAMPVEGINYAQLTDTWDGARGAGETNARRHEALDIMAPRGAKVFAATDGKLVKLFTSKPGGLTIYQFDPSEKYAYYYAHLDRYADGVQEGQTLHKGDLIGYVGSTGNADANAPHLHFAVFELTPQKQWWQGTPINPYPLLKP
jgi:murein DD-endopeptidase MepM/ murein hydrolase activator NlpD